jgi:hypothetical protein
VISPATGVAPLQVQLGNVEPRVTAAHWLITGPQSLVMHLDGLLASADLPFPGAYQATLTVTDIYGQVSTAAHNITVTNPADFVTWAAANNLLGNDALPLADPDLDGINNKLEYSLKTPPKAFTSSWQTAFRPTASGWTVKFPLNKSATQWRLEYSTSMLTNTWYPVLPQNLCRKADYGDTWEMEATLPMAATVGRAFVRMKSE